MEKDVIAVVHDNVIEMVDLRGQPKTTKKIGQSKFEFDSKVDGMGELHKNLWKRLWNCIIIFLFFLSSSSSS